ncbi:MAG: hypothetical protein RIS76_3040 [Verrucomicrobiota bacterium]
MLLAAFQFGSLPLAVAQDTTPGSVDGLNLMAAQPGLTPYGLATAVQPDGKTILAGASFSSILGVARTNIARLHADGTLDLTFDPNANSQVNSVVVQADGKILLGGNFNSLQPNGAVTGTTRSRIARLNADGTLDTTFNPNANNRVSSVAVQADGKILLVGYFTTLQPNGAATATTRNYVARLNADGSLDAAFNPSANSDVLSVAVQADGKILLGGSFTTLQPNGAATATTRKYVARLNADGTLDTGFNPNASSSVLGVAVQPDGKILLGGFFTTLQPNGAATATTRNRIALLNADGSLDAAFNPNADSAVVSMAVQADGKILLGGHFTTLQPNGAAAATIRKYAARLNADGTLDTAFNPNASSSVFSVAVQAGGKILLGGGFTTLQPNGAATPTTRSGFARLNNDAATQTVSVPDPIRALWNRGGSAPEVSQVTFELSVNGGATWTSLGNGTRVGTTANWQLTGLSLPGSGQVRARGRTSGGSYNGSAGLVESVASFSGITLASVPSPDTAVRVAPRHESSRNPAVGVRRPGYRRIRRGVECGGRGRRHLDAPGPRTRAQRDHRSPGALPSHRPGPAPAILPAGDSSGPGDFGNAPLRRIYAADSPGSARASRADRGALALVRAY